MMSLVVTFSFIIFLNVCKLSHSKLYTPYVKDKLLSGFYFESVVKGRVPCVYACSIDDVCFGVAYHESRQMCYFYNTFPRCDSSPDVGMVTYMPKDTYIKNVALNKPTAMSTIYTNGVPCKAVDGNIEGYIHTYRSILEWWCVDLGKIYNFHSIVLYNRIDGDYNMDRLRAFEMRLSDNGSCTLETFNNAIPCYKDTEPNALFVYNITSCNQPNISFSSRFIFISPRPNTVLNFRELVVLE